MVILLAALLFAQASTFEVASVKVSGPTSTRDSGGGPGTRDPGQYHFNSATLQDLIALAYHIDYFQIAAKTPLDANRYDVIAKVPGGATRDQFREMLRNLLAERFHLKIHHETRDFPAWELTIAKSGLKIKESSPPVGAGLMPAPPKIGDDGFPEIPAGQAGRADRSHIVDGFVIVRTTAQQQPVSALSYFGGMPGDPPVVDKTGLTGKYDFKLEFSRELPNPSGEPRVPPVPNLFTAIEQQLGLHLAPKKLPFDVIVVDSVDRVPTENL